MSSHLIIETIKEIGLLNYVKTVFKMLETLNIIHYSSFTNTIYLVKAVLYILYYILLPLQ